MAHSSFLGAPLIADSRGGYAYHGKRFNAEMLRLAQAGASGLSLHFLQSRPTLLLGSSHPRPCLGGHLPPLMWHLGGVVCPLNRGNTHEDGTGLLQDSNLSINRGEDLNGCHRASITP